MGPPLDHPFSLRKYGSRLRAYGVDHLIRLNIPGATIAKSLGELFHYDLNGEHLSCWKADFAELYSDTIAEFTAKITKGPLVHADETAARVVGKSAVVWVLASMEEIVFLYAENREGEMVHELLREFSGVLVSDFYAVYDSFDCPQQKCLIHLIR
ncbi:MAG: transposase, partial [Bacteroidota bacterium]